MRPYVAEEFTPSEAAVLRRYFTNLDQPVFALVNLPEVVKGALFARYSRTHLSLRRLFLKEFVGDLDMSGDLTFDATIGLERAEELYERVFFEYGDDSVAQLGGVHLACEQASNLLTKVLERGRLMSYLEQSTRYIAYDARLTNGRYRYFRDPSVLASPLGARYIADLDRMFDVYAGLLPVLQERLATEHPRLPGDSDFIWRQAVKAKALDSLRGLLPAASLSNVGIYGTGQGYEALLVRMRSHPLPEARAYADLMLIELRKVIPSFLRRVDVPDRGGAWSAYLGDTRAAMHDISTRLLPPRQSPWPGPYPLSAEPGERDGASADIMRPVEPFGGAPAGAGPVGGAPVAGRPGAGGPVGDAPVAGGQGGGGQAGAVMRGAGLSDQDEAVPAVSLVDWDPDGEEKVLVAMLYPYTHLSERQVVDRVRRLSVQERLEVVRAYVGERTNRRHKPGRALERTDYRFDVIADYGAFRDLQRHRILTIEWQSLTPDHGYDLPAPVLEAGLGFAYEDSLERSRSLYHALAGRFPDQASYAVALAFNVRFVMQFNAREAVHLLELRTGPQGHPSYRRVCQQMHRLIAVQAGHRAIAELMRFVDHGDYGLERLDAERRAERRRATPQG